MLLNMYGKSLSSQNGIKQIATTQKTEMLNSMAFFQVSFQTSKGKNNIGNNFEQMEKAKKKLETNQFCFVSNQKATTKK